MDISYNTLGPDGTTALVSWLTECIPYELSLSNHDRTNLHELSLANTDVVWPVLISIFQQHDLNITTLNISSNPIYDKVYCIVNPLISGGHIANLSIGNMKGDLSMVEGICGSLLLNTHLQETHLCLDNTDMDCKREYYIE